MALQSMPGEQVWQPTHAMEFDKENADTPSKRAALGDGPLKSPASVRHRLSSDQHTAAKPVPRLLHWLPVIDIQAALDGLSVHKPQTAAPADETSSPVVTCCRTPSVGR